MGKHVSHLINSTNECLVADPIWKPLFTMIKNKGVDLLYGRPVAHYREEINRQKLLIIHKYRLNVAHSFQVLRKPLLIEHIAHSKVDRDELVANMTSTH